MVKAQLKMEARAKRLQSAANQSLTLKGFAPIFLE
jgi:hypothetical protein